MPETRHLVCFALLLIIFLPLQVSATDPTPEDPQPEKSIREIAEEFAKELSVKFKPATKKSKQKLLGQWYLEGAFKKDCISGFFYEFRANNVARNKRGKEEAFKIQDEVFVIPKEGDDFIYIFQLGKQFYIRSFECRLAKLVRGPHFEVPVAEDSYERKSWSCRSDSDCMRTPDGSCAVAEVGKKIKGAVHDADACRCLTGPISYGCVPRGTSWESFAEPSGSKLQ